MSKPVNWFSVYTFVLVSLVVAPATANENRTKKDLSEVQSALEQSQAEYNAQRKKNCRTAKKLKKTRVRNS